MGVSSLFSTDEATVTRVLASNCLKLIGRLLFSDRVLINFTYEDESFTVLSKIRLKGMLLHG